MVAGPGRDWPREVRGACPPPPTPAPGMEVAAYLTEKAHSVSVVELEETPFRRFLGERVGRALMKVSPPWRPAPSPSEPQAASHPRPPASPLRPDRCLRTTGLSSTCRRRCRSCGPRRERWALLPAPLSPGLELGSWACLLTRPSPQLKEVVLKSSKVVRADVCVVGIGEWVGRQVRGVALGQSLPSPASVPASVRSRSPPDGTPLTGLGLGDAPRDGCPHGDPSTACPPPPPWLRDGTQTSF